MEHLLNLALSNGDYDIFKEILNRNFVFKPSFIHKAFISSLSTEISDYNKRHQRNFDFNETPLNDRSLLTSIQSKNKKI